MMLVVGPVEEEDVPQAAADDARQAAVHSEVEDVDVPAAAVALHDVVRREARRDDAQHK